MILKRGGILGCGRRGSLTLFAIILPCVPGYYYLHLAWPWLDLVLWF
jgi:hypothetical protein